MENRLHLFSNLKDPQWVREVSTAKRFLELLTMVPCFKEKFEADPEQELKKYNIDCEPKDLEFLYMEKEAPLPDMVKKYREFIMEKLSFRNDLQTVRCVPENKDFAIWRMRQVRRCWGELGMKNVGMIHAPFIFELSEGCSVGCHFCALSSRKLSKICKADEENILLWKDILKTVKKIAGKAGGTGTCYYATEPMDNPLYEKFSEVFYEVFETIPQVTTAVALRNVNRVKNFLATSNSVYPTIHRFSVLSLEQFFQILDDFTAEELIMVELLPQFSSAPANAFSKVGRIYDNLNRSKIAETISCISGFVINMANKTIRLLTPCGANEIHPTGEILIASEIFKDANDLEMIIYSMISKYMKRKIDRNKQLRYYPYFVYEENNEKGFTLKSANLFKTDFLEIKDCQCDLLGIIGKYILQGDMNSVQITKTLYKENNIPPEETFYTINTLFDYGVLEESYPEDTIINQ